MTKRVPLKFGVKRKSEGGRRRVLKMMAGFHDDAFAMVFFFEQDLHAQRLGGLSVDDGQQQGHQGDAKHGDRCQKSVSQSQEKTHANAAVGRTDSRHRLRHV